MAARSEQSKPGDLTVDAVLAGLEAAVTWLPVEELERFGRKHFTPSALRRRRLEERDGNLWRLAAGHPEIHRAQVLASVVRTEIEAYERRAWRFERDRPPPTDPRRALIHRVLTLGAGRIPSISTCERAFAGVRAVQNQPRK